MEDWLIPMWFNVWTDLEQEADDSTVGLVMVKEMYRRLMTFNDAYPALQYVKHRVVELGIGEDYLPTKQGEKVMYKDLWDTPTRDFARKEMNIIWHTIVVPYAFEWLVNKLNSVS